MIQGRLDSLPFILPRRISARGSSWTKVLIELPNQDRTGNTKGCLAKWELEIWDTDFERLRYLEFQLRPLTLVTELIRPWTHELESYKMNNRRRLGADIRYNRNTPALNSIVGTSGNQTETVSSPKTIIIHLDVESINHRILSPKPSTLGVPTGTKIDKNVSCM